jgi:hypothetical protein
MPIEMDCHLPLASLNFRVYSPLCLMPTDVIAAIGAIFEAFGVHREKCVVARRQRVANGDGETEWLVIPNLLVDPGRNGYDARGIALRNLRDCGT